MVTRGRPWIVEAVSVFPVVCRAVELREVANRVAHYSQWRSEKRFSTGTTRS